MMTKSTANVGTDLHIYDSNIEVLCCPDLRGTIFRIKVKCTALFACWHLKELKCCASLASSEHPDGSNSCTCIQIVNNTEK
jgi:hypothetical protein